MHFALHVTNKKLHSLKIYSGLRRYKCIPNDILNNVLFMHWVEAKSILNVFM